MFSGQLWSQQSAAWGREKVYSGPCRAHCLDPDQGPLHLALNTPLSGIAAQAL
jgi:hypothetical protein